MMARALNSYVKYLISEHEPIVKLIHKHGRADASHLTDDEINAALNQPYSKVVREALRSLYHYIRTHSSIVETQDSIQVLLTYLTQAMPIVELNRDQLFGETRTQLSDLHEKLYAQFKEIVNFDLECKQASQTLEENYSMLETIGDTIFQNNYKFRLLILQEINRELEKQGIKLSEDEKSAFFNDSSWGELIQFIQTNNIQTPSNVNLAKPDYAAYFELKRCIVIATYQQQHGSSISAKNDSIHPDTLNKIQTECAIDDSVTEVIFSQFNQYCTKAKSDSLDLMKIIQNKKSLLLELNQIALELVTVDIPDSKPLRKIAKETIASDIPLQITSVVKSVPTVKLG